MNNRQRRKQEVNKQLDYLIDLGLKPREIRDRIALKPLPSLRFITNIYNKRNKVN